MSWPLFLLSWRRKIAIILETNGRLFFISAHFCFVAAIQQRLTLRFIHRWGLPGVMVALTIFFNINFPKSLRILDTKGIKTIIIIIIIIFSSPYLTECSAERCLLSFLMVSFLEHPPQNVVDRSAQFSGVAEIADDWDDYTFIFQLLKNIAMVTNFWGKNAKKDIVHLHSSHRHSTFTTLMGTLTVTISFGPDNRHYISVFSQRANQQLNRPNSSIYIW